MSDTHEIRIRQLFDLAMERPPAEREPFLRRLCERGPLLDRVLALLEAHEEAGEFLARPTASPSLEPSPSASEQAEAAEAEGTVIGHYKLLQQIGEGGMGTVWMAEQFEPVRRRVALKIIKLGMDTKQVVVRFEAERQALALMDHPSIAKVLDGGMTAAGRPYFVMELVKGVPITEFCDEAKLGIRQRLELFTQVCHAVQHAHQKGIIHRDLKPSNVMVTLHDGTPVPKVIDFGIAKATNQQLTQRTMFTEYQQILGTPEYMAPEQASMSGLDVDTRADVYSLGVLLYELLTGTKPFDLKEMLTRGYEELLRTIREVDPPKPSTRVSTAGLDTGRISVARQLGEGQLGRALRGDLDWIVVKSMEKDRTRRYETANGLAADIRRFLNDEPVLATPPSAAYRMRKFVRRHRLQVIAASVVVLAMLAGIVGTSWGWVETSRARSIQLQSQLETERRAASDAARNGRSAEAVAAFLDQCEGALRARDPGEAEIALDAARKRAAEGGAEREAERIGRLAADLALLRDLDEIDQFRWTWNVNRFPPPEAVAERIRAALERYGVEPGVVSVEEVVARVNASVIRERIVTALDRSLQQAHATGARAVLRDVDPDPYRDAVRDAVVAGDRARVADLANRDEAVAQPSGFAAFLGTHEAIAPARRRALLLAAVTRWPANVDLLMAMATLSYSYPTDPKESAAERKRWFQAAVAADAGNTTAYNDLGGVLSSEGRLDEAEGYLRKAAAIDPEHAPAVGNLGNLLRQRGRLDEALDCLRTAVGLYPTSASLHSNLGLALDAKGRPQEARECYEIAIACDPGYAEARAHLGVQLAQAGRVDEALGEFQQCTNIDPEDPRAYVAAGTALEQAGRLDEAIAWYRKSAEVAPRNTDALGALGRTLVASGRADEAVACSGKLVELEPMSAAARFWLGYALACQEKDDEAEACFRKTLELDPRMTWAHCNVGYFLAKRAGAQGPADGSERAGLRREALDMMRAELALLSEQLETPGFADRVGVLFNLQKWQQDSELTSIRDAAALARLPEEERSALSKFWDDVAAVIAKARAAVPDASTPSGAAASRAASATPVPDAASAKKRAVSFLEETVERRKVELGPDHPDTIHAKQSLARAYLNAGQSEQAQPLLDSIAKSVTATYGSDGPAAGGNMQTLANLYWRCGRLDRSVPLFEKAVTIYEAAFGRNNRETLGIIANLGVNYMDAGRLAEAIPLLDEAVRAAKQQPRLGWVRPKLSAAYDRAFQEWADLADPDLAAKRWSVLVASLETQAGPDHRATLLARNNLGYFLARSGRFADAEAMLKETIEREVRVLGEGNALLLQTRTNLGELYQMQGRYAEAEELLRRCLAERAKTEPNGFREASTRSMLGRVLAEQKKFAEAEPLLLAGYKGLKENADKTPEWARYYLADTVESLVQLYEDWGKPDEAAKWRSPQDALPGGAGK